jgi:hypothetical protein
MFKHARERTPRNAADYERRSLLVVTVQHADKPGHWDVLFEAAVSHHYHSWDQQL